MGESTVYVGGNNVIFKNLTFHNLYVGERIFYVGRVMHLLLTWGKECLRGVPKGVLDPGAPVAHPPGLPPISASLQKPVNSNRD